MVGAFTKTRQMSYAPTHAGAAHVGGAARPQPQGGVRYGQLYAPPSDDMDAFFRERAEFSRLHRDLGRRNSWLAAPALAPVAVVAGAQIAGGLAARSLASQIPKGPLSFVRYETWQRAAKERAEGAIRDAGRRRFARANGIKASEMEAQVHHSQPLQFRHVIPKADINRLANLWALRGDAHGIANAQWQAFFKRLNGREPTPVEFMREKMRIDRMMEPFIRRKGVPRTRTPRPEGGSR